LNVGVGTDRTRGANTGRTVGVRAARARVAELLTGEFHELAGRARGAKGLSLIFLYETRLAERASHSSGLVGGRAIRARQAQHLTVVTRIAADGASGATG
jgi:hypothetical protein